jgi:xanthine/uracil/vitamin C permease (AzgA family)
MLEKLFGLSAAGTTIRTEVMAVSQPFLLWPILL